MCIAWACREERFGEPNALSQTQYLGMGRALIQLNAQSLCFDGGYTNGILFNMMLVMVLHEMVSVFDPFPCQYEFSSILKNDSHAYQYVHCLADGRDGLKAAHSGPGGYHEENFGTMTRAVSDRLFDLLGLEGDPISYPCHNHSKGEGFSQGSLPRVLMSTPLSGR